MESVDGLYRKYTGMIAYNNDEMLRLKTNMA